MTRSRGDPEANLTLVITGGDEQWGSLDQMVDMQVAIPRGGLLRVNHPQHEWRSTPPWIVRPQVLQFLTRNFRNARGVDGL